MTMKSVFESWRSYQEDPVTIDEQLVIESRYTDAVASSTNWKKIIDRKFLEEVPENYLKNLTDTIAASLKSASEADPTGKNKYLSWLAKALKTYMQRRFKTVTTSSTHFDTPEQAAFDKEEGLQAIADNVQYIVGKFTRMLPAIHKLEEREIIKNIDQYDTIDDLERAVYEGERELHEKEAMEKMKDAAKEETEFIDDNDDYILLRPESAESSCYFGQGTKWCISSTRSQNYFEQYTGEGHAFYFVTFKHLPPDADDRQLAMVFTPNDRDEPAEVFDRPDDEVGTDAVYEAAKANLFYKGLNRMDFYKKLKKKDPEQYAEKTGMDFYDESWKAFENAAHIPHTPIDQFWQEWSSLVDLDSSDYKEVSSLYEAFVDLAQEQASDIIGQSAHHHELNPGGPSAESFEKIYDQYDFQNLYVQYDEYDAGLWSWDAYWSFEPDVEDYLPEDGDNFAEAIRELMDDNHMYPDEIEWDRYDHQVRVRFTPDHDECCSVDEFENFLNRMADYDAKLGEMMADEEALMAAYVEAGAVPPPKVQAYADMFNEIDLVNFEVEYDKSEVSFAAQLRPRIYIPEWILETPDPQVVLNDVFAFLEKTDTKKLISDRVIGVVEDRVSAVVDAIGAQMEIPFGGDEEGAEERQGKAWQKAAEEVGYGRDDNINVGIYPRADSLGFRGAHVEEEGGKKFVIPKWYLTIDLAMDYAGQVPTDEDAQLVVRFAQYLDDRDVFEKVQDLLQVTIDKALSNVDYDALTSVHPDGRPIPYHLGAADVQERQIQEVHRLLNPLYRSQQDAYKEKAQALIREVFNK